MRQLVVSVRDVVRGFTTGQPLNHSTQGRETLVDLGAFLYSLCCRVLLIVTLRSGKVHERNLALGLLLCVTIESLYDDSENEVRPG